jgi:hypothetical protein
LKVNAWLLIQPKQKIVTTHFRAGGPGVYVYNNMTAPMLEKQFGFTGVKLVENFVTEEEENNLLTYLDQAGRSQVNF